MTDLAPVLAADHWRSNAELIRDCATLGYLKKDLITLDPTFGNGVWWKAWRPDVLIAKDRKTDPEWDFTDASSYYDSESFHVVAFDPPYIAPGGRKTSGIESMYEVYGLIDAPKTAAGVQAQINAGITEMTRLLVRGGVLLVKCQSYVSSANLWVGDYYTQRHALEVAGLKTLDRFDHIGKPRPQPSGRTIKKQDGTRVPSIQKHARRNVSTLFVFQKGKR